MATSRNGFLWALALLGLSGASALGQQVLWTRRIADVIGAHVESSARVFGGFFLGLAVGSAVAAVMVPRWSRPWRIVGWIELGAGVLSLPALWLPAWSGWIWPTLGPDRLVGWSGPMVKSLLSVLVIVPPALLLGMILPAVTSAVCGPAHGLATRGIWLYAANTLGGALGLVCVVGFLLHVAGVAVSMLCMIGFNLIAAAICFRLDSAREERALPAAPQPPAAPPVSRDRFVSAGDSLVLPVWLPLLLSFFSGMGVLAFEVAGLEMLKLKMPLSICAPAAVLFCVVLLLGISAAAGPSAARSLGGPERALAWCLAAAGPAIAMAPLIFMNLTAGQIGVVVPGQGFSSALLGLARVTCLSLGPAVFLAGLVFPLLLCQNDPAPGHSAGRSLGRLLAINGLGGIVGAETAYRLLLPSLGVHVALGAVGGFYGLLSVGLTVFRKPGGLFPTTFPFAALCGTGLLVVTALQDLPVFLRTATFNVLEVRSGREGTLAVVERADLGRAMFLDNQYMLGSSRAAADMERQAHLPLLLHPAPRRVGFMGLGTGITAAGALRHDAVQSITVVELSGLVADAAARHFREFNQDLHRQPRVQVHVEDAGTYLAAAPGQFDVIVGDLFTPWQPGEARLCTLEQFKATKDALRSGGLFCQWLPMTQLTREQFEMIAVTFQLVFGEIRLFRNHFKSPNLPVGLVGFKDGRIDWESVAHRCESERRIGRLRDPVCRHPEGLAMLYLGGYPSDSASVQCLNTLGNLRVELDAGRHLLAGKRAEYFHGEGDLWLAFLRRQVAQLEKSSDLPDALRRFPPAGLLASRWETARELMDPAAAALEEELRKALPDCILSDSEADWSLWPGLMTSLPGKSAVPRQ